MIRRLRIYLWITGKSLNLRDKINSPAVVCVFTDDYKNLTISHNKTVVCGDTDNGKRKIKNKELITKI